MVLIKISPVLLLVLIVGAEKKIELQDIEEDNLKSEKEKELEKTGVHPQSTGLSSGPGLPLDFLKNGFLKYFDGTSQPQQPRYIQQYAVTEPPERSPLTPKAQYGAPTTGQQAMVGYLSNVPMQIYLVPQYYNEAEQGANTQQTVQYQSPSGVTRVATYPPPEAVQPQTNYIEVPAYVTPNGKTYVQQYPQPVGYVSYTTQPTIAPTPTVAPVVAYQIPVVQYPTAIVAPPSKNYYHNTPQYTDTNIVEEPQESEIESHKQYLPPTETTYTRPPQEFPRYYHSRAPIRDDYRGPSELPPPNPLILKGPPSHLAHIPKALPVYRPLTKPVYAAAGSLISNTFTPKPSDLYGPPYKRRPTSLLDSYIPSNVQLEYLKRGITRDPLSTYEALSTGRHFPPIYPRHYERGFLPNQMYHTAAGGVTYGHHKRTAKSDKIPQK